MRRDGDWVDAAALTGDAGAFASPERILGDALDLHAANRTLAQLGERTELIFRRFRLEGVTQREIASELGLSVSAVEKHLQKAYRALLELKERLNAE
jgi:RNA polymerase sigma-70 factor (ECF subfamily)